MTHQVDSYRFVDFITRKVVESWIAREGGGVLTAVTIKKMEKQYANICTYR